MATTATRHNHRVEPFAPLQAPGDCPRCDERRDERAADGITDHNHAPQPFGRRQPPGDCPRCDQLRDGAAPREGHGARKARQEAQDRAAHRAHFAPGGPHARGTCGPVCTFGDW